MSRARTPLAIHRRERLLLKQSEVARKLRTSQGHVSKVESGKAPEPWERGRWADAYDLSLTAFMRLISAARASRALQVPVSESEPLFAQSMQSDIRRLALRMMVERTFGKAVRA